MHVPQFFCNNYHTEKETCTNCLLSVGLSVGLPLGISVRVPYQIPGPILEHSVCSTESTVHATKKTL